MPLDFREKVKNLPEPVRKVLLSNLPAEEGFKANTSYGIDEEGQTKVAKLIGLIFIKEAPLAQMPVILQRELGIPESISAGLALALTKAIFLPLKEHFPDAEALIQTWSQTAAPPTHPAQSLSLFPETDEEIEGPESEETVEKDILSAIKENEKIAGQTITSGPIKLPDSELLKLPSIKNWLLDYKKYKSGLSDQDPMLVRVRFVHESPNAKNLNETEKNIVSQLLKSYDEKIKLPFSKKTGLLITGIMPQTQLPKITSPPPKTTPRPMQPSPNPPTQFRPQPPPPPKPSASPSPPQKPQEDIYHEPIEQRDLAGPQAPQKPVPKLNGNIVNLKELGAKNNQQSPK